MAGFNCIGSGGRTISAIFRRHIRLHRVLPVFDTFLRRCSPVTDPLTLQTSVVWEHFDDKALEMHHNETCFENSFKSEMTYLGPSTAERLGGISSMLSIKVSSDQLMLHESRASCWALKRYFPNRGHFSHLVEYLLHSWCEILRTIPSRPGKYNDPHLIIKHGYGRAQKLRALLKVPFSDGLWHPIGALCSNAPDELLGLTHVGEPDQELAPRVQILEIGADCSFDALNILSVLL